MEQDNGNPSDTTDDATGGAHEGGVASAGGAHEIMDATDDAHEIMRGFKILRDRELSRHKLNRLEQRIANGLLDGETNDTIAQHVSLSASGVKYHIKSIYRKSGCIDRAGFFRTIRNGMDGIAGI